MKIRENGEQYTPAQYDRFLLQSDPSEQHNCMLSGRDYDGDNYTALENFHGGESAADQLRKQASTVTETRTYVLYNGTKYPPATFDRLVQDWNKTDKGAKPEITYQIKTPDCPEPATIKQPHNYSPMVKNPRDDMAIFNAYSTGSYDSQFPATPGMIAYLQDCQTFLENYDSRKAALSDARKKWARAYETGYFHNDYADGDVVFEKEEAQFQLDDTERELDDLENTNKAVRASVPLTSEKDGDGKSLSPTVFELGNADKDTKEDARRLDAALKYRDERDGIVDSAQYFKQIDRFKRKGRTLITMFSRGQEQNRLIFPQVAGQVNGNDRYYKLEPDGTISRSSDDRNSLILRPKKNDADLDKNKEKDTGRDNRNRDDNIYGRRER